MTITEEAIKTLIDTVKDSKSFVLEQAPSVAVEMVRYGRLGIIIPIILFPISLFLIGYGYSKRKCADWNDSYIGVIIFGFIVLLLVIPVLLQCTGTLMAWVSPKLYILNELRKISK